MINDSIDNIRLDLNREKVNAAVYVREGDTKSRTLHCTLADGGKVVSLADAIFAEILIKKPDGYEADNSVVVVGDELQYTWRTSDLSANGENICQFMVTFDDGSVVTSPEFSLYVYRKKVNQKTQISTNEYTALTEQVVMAKQFATSASDSATQANTYRESTAEILESANAVRDEVLESETNAKVSETNAKASEEVAIECLRDVEDKVEQAEAYKDDALASAENAAAHEAEAKNASDNAERFSELAEAHYLDAQGEALKAENSAIDANASKTSALSSETSAKAHKDDAEQASENAHASEISARDYYDKCEEVYEKIGGGTLVLGETATTAFRGDYGKFSYDHANTTSGNPHNVTYTEVGADKSGSAAEMYQQATGYTDKKIADLIGGAPETLDTLKEIADAMAASSDVVKALEEAIGTKANESEFQVHQNNEIIHITSEERAKWDEASTDSSETKSVVDEMTRIVYAHCNSSPNLREKEITETVDIKDNDIIVISFKSSNTFSCNETNGYVTIAINNEAYSIYSKNSKTKPTGSSVGAYGSANCSIMYRVDTTEKALYFMSKSWDDNTTYTNGALGQGYMSCTTAEATLAKTVSYSEYSLVFGGICVIKFTNSVPANSTLNINGRGAKAIYFRDAPITDGVIKAGDTCTFIFDGTRYRLLTNDRSVIASNAIGYPYTP